MSPRISWDGHFILLLYPLHYLTHPFLGVIFQSMERAYCKHQHVFHVPKKEAEGRVLLVFLLTLAFMFVEIASGYIFGSVALLADGIHMGTHALAFGISFTAYMLARRWSKDV